MKKIYILSAVVMGLCATSCDSYLDINTDPNSPSEEVVTADIVMPAAEMNYAATYGNLLRIPCGYFTEHFGQYFGTSNYVAYSQFEMSATRSSSAYTQMLRAITNMQTVIDKSTASGQYASALAATCIRALSFEALVDVYGSVPFTEALDPSNTSPVYEDGLTVYQGLISELDQAIKLTESATNKSVCTNFLYPNGDYTDWIKFANAIKLRMLTRISGCSGVDVTSTIGALIAENNFPTEDVAYTCWGTTSGNMNPYYSEEFATSFGSTQLNVVANMALIGTMLQKDNDGNIVFQDGRLAKFFNTNGNGEYFGSLSGTNNSTTGFSTANFCRPIMDAQTPLCIISVSDIDFYIAEYYAKQKDADNASYYYNEATRKSFESAGATGAEDVIARYPLNKDNLANYKEVIGIAKWVALSGVDNVESYAEMRRLRYPAMGSVTGEQIWSGNGAYNMNLMKPGVLYTPYQVYSSVGKGNILERWPYAESSSSRNSNCPSFANSDFTKKIFFAN